MSLKFQPRRPAPVVQVDPQSVVIPDAKVSSPAPGHHILDAWGDPWRVDSSRGTDHGFEIYLGRPLEATGPMGPQVIVTHDLAQYFETNRRYPGLMSIPLGKNTITRLRRVLGHNRYQDAEMWWHERIHDLATLTIADFVVRHRASAGAVSQARTALIGPHQRPLGWWKTPEMIALLQSKMPSAWIAEKMGISAVTVRKYRGMQP